MLRNLIWGDQGAPFSPPEESLLFSTPLEQEQSSSSGADEGGNERKEKEALIDFQDYLPGLRPTRMERVGMLRMDPYIMCDPEITIGVLAKARQGYTGPWESYKYIPSPIRKAGVQNFASSRRSCRSRLNDLLWLQLARAVGSGDVAAEARVVSSIHRLGFSLRPATHGSTVRLLRRLENHEMISLYFHRVLGVKQRAIGRLQGAEGLCLLRDYLCYLCDYGLYSQGLYAIQIISQSSSIISSHPSLASYSGLIYLILAICMRGEDNNSSKPGVPDLRSPFSMPVLTALSRATAEPSSVARIASARLSFEKALQSGEGMALHLVGTTGLLAAILAVDGENGPIVALSRLMKLTSTASSCPRVWELLFSFLIQYKTAISNHFDTETWSLYYRNCVKGWLTADELSLVAMYEWLRDFRSGGTQPPFQLLVSQIEHWAVAAPKSSATLMLWDALAIELGAFRVRDYPHQECPPMTMLMGERTVYDCLWSDNPFPVSDLDDWNDTGSFVHPLLAAEGLNLSWWGKAYFHDPELQELAVMPDFQDIVFENCPSGDSDDEDCCNLNRKTVAELRNELRERKLPVHGSKSKLIHRLELEIRIGKQKEAASSTDLSAGSGQTDYYVPPKNMHSNLLYDTLKEKPTRDYNQDYYHEIFGSSHEEANQCALHGEAQEQNRKNVVFSQNEVGFEVLYH